VKHHETSVEAWEREFEEEWADKIAEGNRQAMEFLKQIHSNIDWSEYE